MVGEMEFAAFVEMTFETGLGRFPRIDNGVVGTTGLIVEAAGTMA